MTTETISDRQLEIIEAAGKILTASGISGLTIKNLAKEMKFSESAIYRHFTSKEEIIIALLDYLAQSMDERYSNAIKSEHTPEEKFTLLFQNQFLNLSKSVAMDILKHLAINYPLLEKAYFYLLHTQVHAGLTIKTQFPLR